MKKLLLFFLMLPILASAQTANRYLGVCPVKDGRINYTGVDSVHGANSGELYNRAKGYLAQVFPNFKDVVKLDDREMGKLSVRGIFQTPIRGKGLIGTTYEFYARINIEVKDGRYRYEVSDFQRTDGNGEYEYIMFNKKKADKISAEIDPYIKTYIAGLNSAMNGAAADNW